MSCQKDDCGSCVSPAKPPEPTTTLKAKAGPDQSITLSTNAALLDGSQSTPTDGAITYSWSKISGPATFHIVDAASAKTQVNNLVRGNYQFELKIINVYSYVYPLLKTTFQYVHYQLF